MFVSSACQDAVQFEITSNAGLCRLLLIIRPLPVDTKLDWYGTYRVIGLEQLQSEHNTVISWYRIETVRIKYVEQLLRTRSTGWF